MRPAHQQRYELILPILSDPEQLSNKPAVFRNLAETQRRAFENSSIAPKRSRTRRRPEGQLSSSTSASDTEGEELFHARLIARTTVLAELAPVFRFEQSSEVQ
jgi:hypothetical protein